MANGFKGITNGIRIVPGTTPGSVLGDVRVDSTSSLPMFYNGSREISMLTSSSRYNVKDYGAKGDGTTDDTSAIESAVAAATNGGQIYFPQGTYKCNSDLDVSVGSTWILGEGLASKLVFADGYGLRITTNNVRVSDLWLDGQNYSTGTSTGNIVQARGTNSSNYLENIIVDNCYITNVPQTGINLRFVQNFKLTNNRIENVYYAGISVESGTHGEITNNQVIDINPGSLTAEAYGIAVTRNQSDLTTAPRSKYILVSNNIIHNNPIWEGLDTHSGDYIVFSNNVVTGCKLGILVAADGQVPANYAPRHCIVSNNIVDSQITDGSASYGIVVAGDFDSSEYALSCTVVGNTVNRYGDQSSSTGCAMYFYATRGLTVAGNSIVEAGSNAIYLSVQNYGFSITGNSIVDVFSNTIGRATGIYSNSNDQTGLIEGNVFTTGTKSATSVMTQAMNFLNTRTGYDIILGQNYWTGSAATYLADAPSGVSGGRLIAGGSPSYQFTNASAQNSLIYNSNDNSALIMSGGSASSNGRNLIAYSSAHASTPSSLLIRRGTTTEFSIDSVGAINIGASAGIQKITVNGFIAHNYGTNNQGYSLLSSQGGTAGFNVMGASASENLGRNLIMYSSAHATLPDVLRIRQATSVQLEIASGGAITLGSTSATNTHVINGSLAHNYGGAQGYSLLQNSSTSSLNMMGAGTSSSNSRNMFFYGSVHSTLPNVIQIRENTAVQFQIASGGTITLGSTSSTAQHIINGAEATSATVGTTHALPATVDGYLTFTINGTTRKIPFFKN